jgi:hypothetical protein
MKSFIEFLEEGTLNESFKAVLDVGRAAVGAANRVGASAVVKNIAKAGEKQLSSMLKNLKGPGVKGTGRELSTTGPAKTGELLPRQPTSRELSTTGPAKTGELLPRQSTSRELSTTGPAKTGELLPRQSTSNVPAVAQQTVNKELPASQTKPQTKTLGAPQISTNTKSITPTKPPEPPIGQEPIPPKPSKLRNWTLGKSGFLSQNPGFIPSIKGHGRFYSP